MATLVGEIPTIRGSPAPRAAAAASLFRSWRYADAGRRDLRLDLLRGYAVVAMVVDHVGGPSRLYAVTGGNRFFVSAAEGFVFISGVVVGIVYGGLARAGGLRAALPKLLARAWQLYAVAVWLALTSALVDVLLHAPRHAGEAVTPARFVLEVVAVRRTSYLVDVMLLYAFLLLLAPLALWLLARGRWWLLLLACWGLWAACQVWPEALELPWPIAGSPVFALGSWQVLFFSGMALGHGRDRAGRLAARWPRSPLRDGWLVPLAALLALLVWVHATDGAAFAPHAPGGDAAALLDAWFDKRALPPARLAACAVVFAFAWALVSRCWRPLRAALGWLLLPLGQGALYAYAAHLFVVALAQAGARRVWGGADAADVDPGINALVQLGALLALWALTRTRFLESVVAPLGGPPVRQLARTGRRPALRPSDSLAVILLAALVAGGFAASGGSAAAAATPSGDAGPGTGAAPPAPASTITAPRRVAGPAGGRPAATATRETPAASRPSAVAATAVLATPAAQAATARSTPVPSGTLEDGVLYSAALGRIMPYGIYLPPGYGEGAARYPVLYMLHGAGGHYSEWVDYGLAEAAERLIGSGAIAPLIIVMPQGDRSYWVNHAGQAGAGGERWGDYVARDLVAHVDATYRTLPDARHRAVGGLSMGGFGALQLAFGYPDTFGAVGAHSPALRTGEEVPELCGGEPGLCALLEPARLFAAVDPARAPAVWLDVGADDPWAPRVADLAELLRARGVRHEYLAPPGGHDAAYWRGHAGDYLRFYAGAFLRGPRSAEGEAWSAGAREREGASRR